MSRAHVARPSPQSVHSQRLREDLHSTQLSNGLQVVLAPKPGRATKFASICTRFGSLTTSWKGAKGHQISVPAGVAHFLEHQLFKKAHGDLSDRFAALGAYCNAYTTYASTCYYFDTVSAFRESLDVLLELAFTPFFDTQLVEIEREIIVQELKSYHDQASWTAYQSLLKALYHQHPVREDIGGSVASVRRTSTKHLAQCHERFYHPSNCGLFVSGDVDFDGLCDQADAWFKDHGISQKRTPSGSSSADTISEPVSVAKRKTHTSMQVVMPQLLMGFKDTPAKSAPAQTKREIALGIACDLLFGASSDFYRENYQAGILSPSFSSGYQSDEGYGFATIGGGTPSPDQLKDRILERIDAKLTQGFDEPEVERIKHKVLGRFLRGFDSLESTALAHQGAWLQKIDLFQYPEYIDAVKAGDVTRCARQLFQEERLSTSTVGPARKANR